MKLTSVSLTLLATVCLALFVVFPGCESEHGGHLNLPPHVSVTGGPPQGGETYYKVAISWVGWDEDGTVSYFLYAIDDTTQWTEIRQLEETFLFSADSLREGEEFGRWHTFWIKAVDNDGAKSVPDYVTFDARTVSPKTTITYPCDVSRGQLCPDLLEAGTTTRFAWTGTDPDCSCPDKKPVAYQWRLVSLSALLEGAPPRDDPAFVEHVMAATPENQPDTSSHWSEFSPDTQVVLTDLTPGAFYEFAVRAIDEAGAIEPGHSGYNEVLFKVMQGDVPTLCVYQSAGSHCFPADGSVWERGAFPGVVMTFSWQGDASAYGGTITAYRYGVDIQNLDDPAQWATEWSATATSTSVTFAEPGVHYLYVETIDNVDAVTLGTVEITVSEMSMDREVLYVDDFYDIIPSDAAHDNFMKAILTRCLDYTDSVYVFSCWLPGPDGVPAEMSMMLDVPTLEELSRYRFVIWDCNASQNSFTSGLNGAIVSGALDTYLSGGGRLWIYGWEIVRGSAEVPLEFDYGTVPEQGSFAREFLCISGLVNRPLISTSNRGDGFRRALPNRRVSDLLPTLEIDYSKGGTSTVYGMTKVEAITFVKDTGLQGVDTLFFYGANSTESGYNNKTCGLRSLDPYSGRKVVYLGFPIHYFFESNAESLATFVTDWMLGDAGASPRRVTRR